MCIVSFDLVSLLGHNPPWLAQPHKHTNDPTPVTARTWPSSWWGCTRSGGRWQRWGWRRRARSGCVFVFLFCVEFICVYISSPRARTQHPPPLNHLNPPPPQKTRKPARLPPRADLHGHVHPRRGLSRPPVRRLRDKQARGRFLRFHLWVRWGGGWSFERGSSGRGGGGE